MKTIDMLQFLFEILVAIGFAIGLIPFGYLFTVWWVVPLTIVNLIFSLVSGNKTLPYTITNVVMGIFALIPILGYLFRAVGIAMSALSAIRLNNKK